MEKRAASRASGGSRRTIDEIFAEAQKIARSCGSAQE
jgi:hypothetical protein